MSRILSRYFCLECYPAAYNVKYLIYTYANLCVHCYGLSDIKRIDDTASLRAK